MIARHTSFAASGVLNTAAASGSRTIMTRSWRARSAKRLGLASLQSNRYSARRLPVQTDTPPVRVVLFMIPPLPSRCVSSANSANNIVTLREPYRQHAIVTRVAANDLPQFLICLSSSSKTRASGSWKTVAASAKLARCFPTFLFLQTFQVYETWKVWI